MLCLRSWNRTFPVSATKFWTFSATESHHGGPIPPAARPRFETRSATMVRPVTTATGAASGPKVCLSKPLRPQIRRTESLPSFAPSPEWRSLQLPQRRWHRLRTERVNQRSTDWGRTPRPPLPCLQWLQQDLHFHELGGAFPASLVPRRTPSDGSACCSHAWAATFRSRQVSPLRPTLSQMDCFTRRGLGKTWASPGKPVLSPEVRPTLIRWMWAL